MSLLEELQQRYERMASESTALDERQRKLRLGMNEILPAIWALEADFEKSKHTFDDGEAMRKAATDASRKPEAPAPTTVSDSGEGAALIEFMNRPGAKMWSGGSCPVDPDIEVEYLLEEGDVCIWDARDVQWSADGQVFQRVLAYRILQDREKDEEAGGVGEYEKGYASGWAAHDRSPHRGEEWQRGYNAGSDDRSFAIKCGEAVPNYDGTHPEPPQPQQPATPIPDGFTKWEGGECPVDAFSMVECYVGDYDQPMKSSAISFNWSAGWSFDDDASPPTSVAPVRAYRIVEPETDKSLIVDDTPTIPRSEIPPGAAVETFTDAGVETVKLSGLTHIVTDDPAGIAETKPEAAYAPIHNEDEPATDPVADDFVKGILNEVEAKAEPKRINIFGIEFGAKKLVQEGV